MLVDFCEYQKLPEVLKQNEAVIQRQKYVELNAEIDEMLPEFKGLLTPKKEAAIHEGASVLRTGIRGASAAGAPDMQGLKANAEKMYRWLQRERSRIRMLMTWQAAGGLSFVVSAHHRATQCFVSHGNEHHEGMSTGVSLQEFQEAVVSRHSGAAAGMPVSQSQSYGDDFAEAASSGGGA